MALQTKSYVTSISAKFSTIKSSSAKGGSCEPILKSDTTLGMPFWKPNKIPINAGLGLTLKEI